MCGIIGHTDKSCTKKLAKEDMAPFNRELRFIPPKKRFGGEGWRGDGGLSNGGRFHESRYFRRGGSRGWSRDDSGSRNSGGRLRSDVLTANLEEGCQSRECREGQVGRRGSEDVTINEYAS